MGTFSTENNQNQKKRNHKYLNSFVYAFKGLSQIFINGYNFRLQFLLAVIALTMALILNCSFAEWIFILICSGLVLTAEAFNSVLEELVNLAESNYSIKAGKIKDMAAAASLIASFFAFVVGLIIFLPKLYIFVKVFFNLLLH